MDTYLGAIFSFGFNFAPANTHLPCDGRLLPISNYEALYTLIGTTYGGDGTTTFGLPDLRSRVPIGVGQGVGLANYILGQKSGSEGVSLMLNNLPLHTHTVASAQIPVGDAATTTLPTNAYFATSGVGDIYSTPATAGATMAADTGNSSVAGASLPVDIRNPYQAVYYAICVVGIYPQHS